MNTRELTQEEQNNLTAIKESIGDFALLYVTETGLEKSILDATQPFRTLLKETLIHNFKDQKKGQENKVLKIGNLVDDNKIVEITISFYRPNTKDGDPRFWIYDFKNHAKPDDVFVLFSIDRLLCLRRLSRSSLSLDLKKSTYSYDPTKRANNAVDLFRSLAKTSSDAAAELLSLLRDIARKGPLVAECVGDTSIGRSIESALGIKQNSNKSPDYKGIEIKSSRKFSKYNLFSKTPDWERSYLKNNQDYADLLGYELLNKPGKFLRGTVYASHFNPKGLRLNLNTESNDLEEIYNKYEAGPIALWSLDVLHTALKNKHNETFFVKADAEFKSDGREYFQLKSVTHTKKPIIPQFDLLLSTGKITVDHTIFTEDNKLKDKGYLFKVSKKAMPELFTGIPQKYDLV